MRGGEEAPLRVVARCMLEWVHDGIGDEDELAVEAAQLFQGDLHAHRFEIVRGEGNDTALERHDRTVAISLPTVASPLTMTGN